MLTFDQEMASCPSPPKEQSGYIINSLGALVHTPGSPRHLDEEFIQKGHMGVATGQGFYSYPNPDFAQPGFV